MRDLLQPLLISLSILVFIACNNDEQQTATDPNAPNTLESLLNPNINNANTTNTSPVVVNGSMNLNDIWVLGKINSKEKYNVNLENNTPILTLDTIKNTMSGHTGCNSIGSKLKVQGNKLVFDDLQLTSNQPCADKGFEKKLLSMLRTGNTTFKILNDSLYLNPGSATEFIYRRIRR